MVLICKVQHFLSFLFEIPVKLVNQMFHKDRLQLFQIHLRKILHFQTNRYQLQLNYLLRTKNILSFQNDDRKIFFIKRPNCICKNRSDSSRRCLNYKHTRIKLIVILMKKLNLFQFFNNCQFENLNPFLHPKFNIF